MKGNLKRWLKNISKNAVDASNSVTVMAENYQDAMEFIMEKGLYPEFLQFQISKEEGEEMFGISNRNPWKARFQNL